MTNKIVLSFLAGSSGRFITGVLNYMMLNTSLDILTDIGSAHNDPYMNNNWWITDWGFLKEYGEHFNDIESLSLLDGGTATGEVRWRLGKHANKYNNDPFVIKCYAENYNMSPELLSTHCINLGLLRNIHKYLGISPIILQVTISSESEYNYCKYMSSIKNTNVRDRGTTVSDISNHMDLKTDYPVVLRFPLKTIMIKDVESTLALFKSVAEKLEITLSEPQINTIRDFIISYFNLQPIYEIH
jgi:hypothetical protein